MVIKRLTSLIAAVFMAGALAAPTAAEEFRLLMIEQVGCYVCTAFNRDVAPAYRASAENDVAPLIHADLRGALPEGVTLTSRPFVTPTFILLNTDGQEVGRLIGFPGEDFFWAYINEMFDTARAAVSG
jgi:thioredoxin-related protein